VTIEFSEEFYVKVRVHQLSVLSHLLFAVVVDKITVSAREGLLKEILYADDLVLISETMEDLRRFIYGKRGLKVKG